jgi:hypothetical protein
VAFDVIRALRSAWRAMCGNDERRAFASRVERALAAAPRGGLRRDVLDLESVSATMHVTWTARPVHPWDRDLSSEQQDAAFAEQCLHDVDVAIARLFSEFAAVDRLDIIVRHPDSRTAILTGTAHRADFDEVQRLSTPMRLRMVGLAYELGRGGLRPLTE